MSVLSCLLSCARWLWSSRRCATIVLTPLLLLPLPIKYNNEVGYTAYVLLLMAVFWSTEVIPIAATALIPVALFPMLGVVDAKTAAKNYMSDSVMLLLGGLAVAISVEKWNLHKRFALRLLMCIGSSPPLLTLGFMLVTSLLSMFISNTATTSMMLPIAHAVLEQLERSKASSTALESTPQHQTDKSGCSNGNDANGPLKSAVEGGEASSLLVSSSPKSSNKQTKQSKSDEDFGNIRKMITLCICYSANIGGTASLTGTPPNVVFKGYMDNLYGVESGINFTSFFIACFPNAVLCIIICWLWLQIFYLGPRKMICCMKSSKDSQVARVIALDYKALGKFRFAEGAVLCHFILLVALWFTRQPGVFPGWARFFKNKYVTDGNTAILVALSLFIFPSSLPTCLRRRRNRQDLEEQSSEVQVKTSEDPVLLDWGSMHQKIPWGIMLLLGGGFTLAQACQKSGLSAAVSAVFNGLSGVPSSAVVLIMSLILSFCTEITSNTGTTTILLPIVSDISRSLQIHPVYLMLPITVSASFAFMLPVATPPNAIVFAYGYIKVIDMVKTGFVLNLLCVFILQFSINTYGSAYFGLTTYPQWAVNANMAASGNGNATLLSELVSQTFNSTGL